MENIPYIVFEGEMTRQERTIKRLWILVIILIALLVVTNCAWLYYESQYQVVETETQKVTQTVSGEGSNSFVGGDYNGGETND